MTINRLKKSIRMILVIICCASYSSAFAGEDGSPFEGLYVGIAATKATFDSTALYRDAMIEDSLSNFNEITGSSSKNSWGGGILAGYGLNYGPVYVGAEAVFIIDKGSTTFTDGTTDIRIWKNNTFDINLRSGITVSDKALVYGLIGYSGAAIKSLGTNGVKDDSNIDYSTRVTGLQYGGGVELAIMENIAARIEYTRAKFNDAVYLDGTDEFTFKPKTSRIMLSFVLHMY